MLGKSSGKHTARSSGSKEAIRTQAIFTLKPLVGGKKSSPRAVEDNAALSHGVNESMPDPALFPQRVGADVVRFVRSAYYVQRNLQKRNNNVSDPSSSSESRTTWKFLSNCKVPNKVKIFVWGLYNNALPIAPNMILRGVEIDSSRPFCQSHTENLEHLFLNCTFTRQSKFVKHVINPTRAETLAARMKTEMTLDFPGRTIEVEGDCLFSRRSANKVAHALARRVVEVNGSNISPDTLKTILQRDMEPSE
ncbi:UNVERIFIED_CONTAM: hypothetical protein Scaly_2737900 [Sesamum calycinum]|uniref:Reverse transcriptase zinc-binding domain-containing protein n=1 Tax=Sesamum calycinum TaxID=2727403 RepID=A0AAW2J1C8_9LAMI